MLDRLKQYNVVWDSPSRDASGSMPLGNGDIGLNVWVEESGELLLLIGKTDAWDENSINMKLGRVRVKFSPNPLAQGGSCRQELELAIGEIRVELGGVTVRICVDANHPVIRIDVESASPVQVEVSLE